MRTLRYGLLVVCGLTVACAGDRPLGLVEAPAGSGPTVIYEPTALPDPEVPMPNDSATRLDTSTATGRRLNVSTKVPLEVEHLLRTQLNRLDGWSVNPPISVRFDAPIDPTTATTESVLLVDVSPESPEFGRKIPLDLGDGAFPVKISPRAVFPFEANRELTDLVFGPENEVDGKRLTHWEVETNTLIARPLFSLRPQNRYAVVLTRDITDAAGQPVRSPFPGIAAANQVEDLRPVLDFVAPERIAFTWIFTTRSTTTTLETIRDGLDGEGPLAWLQSEYPLSFSSVSPMGTNIDGDGSVEELPNDPRDHDQTLKPNFIPYVLSPLPQIGGGLAGLHFEAVDYVVFGEMDSVNVRGDDGAIWVEGGSVDHAPAKVPFMIAVPKETAEHKAPFPVVLYNHGARVSRMEPILIAEKLAEVGFAVMAIDAAGHGPFGGDIGALLEREAAGAGLPPEFLVPLLGELAKPFLGGVYEYEGKELPEILEDLKASGLWRALFVDGRAEDLDGDGVLLSGDGYFVPNPFALASNAAQTVVDNMVALRLLRSLGKVPAALDDPRSASATTREPNLLAGDFNADGVLDLGGPANDYFVAGTSLGGFHSSILLAVEPSITSGVPIVSGGGFVDVMVRTNLSDAVDAVLAEPLGPAIVACPVALEDDEAPPEEVSLSWNNWSLKCRDSATIAVAERNSELGRIPARPGATIRITNPRVHGKSDHVPEDETQRKVVAGDQGEFSITVAANVGDELILEILTPDGEVEETHTIIARRAGLGRARNTPRFRRLVHLAQTALDLGDPGAYARHLIIEPVRGAAPKNVLHLAATGDRTVPFATMVAWQRSAGLLGTEAEALAFTKTLAEAETLDGTLVADIEAPLPDPIGNTPAEVVGLGPLPPIETTSGKSAARFATTKKHEYIGIKEDNPPFDWTTYHQNQLVLFLQSRGQTILDDLCLETTTCDLPWHTKQD